MNALVFAGTTEGRKIAEYLAGCGVFVTACVATGYGAQVMPKMPGLTVRVGRLSREQMARLAAGADFVVDATHPYAAAATENIRGACRDAGRDCFRLQRSRLEAGNAVVVPDAARAAEFLNTTSGNALITTGSKELAAFTKVKDFQTRLYARILPAAGAVEACAALGFKGRNLVCMQGPFTYELNLALLRQIDARFLVTKESGREGGFEEKLGAAAASGARAVVIGRPPESEGLPYGELLKRLGERFGIGRGPDGKRVKKMKAVLILAHGSRAKETVTAFMETVEQVKKRLPDVWIEPAFMEIAEPNLLKGLSDLADRGADEITVTPYFLFEGMHIRRDIPALIEKFRARRPGVRVTLGNVLGTDVRLADVLTDRVREAL